MCAFRSEGRTLLHVERSTEVFRSLRNRLQYGCTSVRIEWPHQTTEMALPATIERWRSALKLPSFPKLLVPLALGQAMGFADTGRFSWLAAILATAFVLLDGTFVVLMNDWSDRDVDAIKRQRFPSAGSPKTIPDGIIVAPRVLFAAVVAGALATALAIGSAALLGRPWYGVMGLLALLVFVSYSLPPLALNYRGGGEVLEALGVGALLPWMGAYSQTGVLVSPHLVWLPGLVLLSFASAVASGLSDEESDREGGKTTFTTRFGNAAARRTIEFSAGAGLVLWTVFPALFSASQAWVAIPATAMSFFHLRRMLALSPWAVTNAFHQHGWYKTHLHRAIWRGALVLAGTFALRAGIGSALAG